MCTGKVACSQPETANACAHVWPDSNVGQAESDSWNAKLMAHREFHEREVESLRRAAKEESEAKVKAVWGNPPGWAGHGGRRQRWQAVYRRRAALHSVASRFFPFVTSQVSGLEEQCATLAADLRLAKQQHEEAAAQQTQQHTAQVLWRCSGPGGVC